MKRGPDIGGTEILQIAIIVSGLVGGAVCYFVLSTVVEPRLRRYWERKFGVLTLKPGRASIAEAHADHGRVEEAFE